MTIASKITAETMLGNGANRKFPFTFRAWPGEIRVVITAPDDTATAVTGLADIVVNETGGTVTYPKAAQSPALPVGWKLTVLRDMNFLQNVRLVNAARFDPEVVEQEFDRLTAMCQQLKEQSERTLSVAEGASIGAQELLDDIYSAEQRIREIAAQAEGTALQIEANAQAAALSELRADLAAAAAKADADRAARLVDPASLASSVFNVRKAQVLEAGATGRIVELPGYYYPGRDVLYLAYNGIVLTPIKPGVQPSGDYSYEEVGDDPNVESNKVKLHFATQAGDVLDMFVVASAAGRNIERIEALVLQAAGSADAAAQSVVAADQEADRAQDEADRAAIAAAALPDVSTAADGDVITARTVGGVKRNVYAPPGNAAPSRADLTLGAVAAGDAVAVPAYVVGAKKLEIYLDGILCAPGAAGFYQEQGVVGATSASIKINDALDAGRKLTAIVAG